MEIFHNIFGNNISSVNESLDDADMRSTMVRILCDIDNMNYGILKESYSMLYNYSMSNDYEYLLESSENIFTRMANAFKEMIRKLVEFVKNAFKLLASYVGDFDKFIDKYKKELGELNPSFDIMGYEYTFNSNSPNISPLKNLVTEYNSELSNINNMSLQDVADLRNNFENANMKDRLRSKVLGTSNSIMEEDYLDEVKKIYRNGNTEESNIHVNKSVLTKTITDYKSLKDMKRVLINESAKIQDAFASLESFFTRGVYIYKNAEGEKIRTSNINYTSNKISYDNTSIKYDTGMLKKINMFYNIKFEQSRFLSNIIMTCYFEKINAVKEALKQSRIIVRKSMFNTKDENTN
jgi:hypothetical protein